MAFTILLLVLSSCVLPCLCLTGEVYILPSEGDNYCPGNACYNVSTFGEMAESFSNSSGLVVHFLNGTHLLDLPKLVVFTNLTNAVFEGEETIEQSFNETTWQSDVVVNCSGCSSGIAFVNGFNITFKHITLTNCGGSVNGLHTIVSPHLCSASLGFLNVRNSIINFASVQKGSGIGLLVVNDGSDLTISDSSFTQNKNNSLVCFGGNLAIFYTDPLVCPSYVEHQVYKTVITSTNTSFGTSNKWLSGGITLFMLHTTYHMVLDVNSVVAYGNRGRGNMMLVTKPGVIDYEFNLRDTLSTGSNGVGLLVRSEQDVTYVDSSSTRCKALTNHSDSVVINIENCLFTDNHGDIDHAGVDIGSESIRNKFTVIIKSTTISHNSGFVSALNLFSFAYQGQCFVSLTNVTVDSNWSRHKKSPHQRGYSSTILVLFITELELKNVSIINNNSTGLAVYRTAISLSDNSTLLFDNNAGIDGGGLALYGDSYLVLNDTAALHFTNNRATRGAAIYVDLNTRSSITFCFFQYFAKTNILPKLFFSSNYASVAGSVLYGDDIDNCSLILSQAVTGLGNLFDRIFSISNKTNDVSLVSSAPRRVCFCVNNTPSCEIDTLYKSAYPGETVRIAVVTVGQRSGVVPGTFQLSTNSSANNPESMYYNTKPKQCTDIHFAVTRTTYSLNVLDVKRYPPKTINIVQSPCPPGFQLSNKGLCDCKELKKVSTSIACDASTKTITRRQSGVWIGNISGCIAAYTCPFDYCNTLSHVNFKLNNPDPQCSLNRTGILCGQCKEGLSLALGSNDCIQCPDFSYLAFTVLYAAAGLGLVAVLMVFNLTVSTGTINGLIFYASIVKISEGIGIFFPYGSIPVLSQFIAWLNLDLGVETCFYKSMTAYHKVWLQFAFPLYIWLIIATVIILCHYSTRVSVIIGDNIVQVLATLILLSFTKIFRTFAPALTWINVPCIGSNDTRFVWYMDGNVPYSSAKHALLVAAAVMFMLLAVPYTFALMFDPWIEKYLTRVKLFNKCWIRFKPFFDAYHGPYKDKCRFWTGLLLLARMVFTLISLFLDRFSTLVFITTIITVILSLKVIFEGVYQKRHLNVLECSSYLNLGLLSALAAVYQNSSNKEQLVTIVSVGTAFATFTGVLLYHMFLIFRNSKHYKKFSINKKFIRIITKDELEKISEEDIPVEPVVVKPTSTEVCLSRETLLNFED